MAIHPVPVIVEIVPEAPPLRRSRSTLQAWAISGTGHAVALLLMTLVVTMITPPETEMPPFRAPPRSALPPVEPPRSDPKHLIENPMPPIETDCPVETVPTAFTLLAPDPEVVETISDDQADTVTDSGDPDKVGDIALGGFSLGVGIGAGSDQIGNIGNGPGSRIRQTAIWHRTPPGQPDETLPTVDRCLAWFKRHQSPNGQWDVDGYQMNCDAQGRCEPGSDHTGDDGDVACTAYAIYCFLGSGYDHRMASRYKRTIGKGIEWLTSKQAADGSFGRNYEHAIATMVLSEAYAMSNDPRLRVPTQKAVDVLLARQNPDPKGGYPMGWDYLGANPERNDSSVTGWCVMALKAAQSAGLNVGQGLDGGKNWLEHAWQAANPDHQKLDPYKGQSSFPYTWNAKAGTTERDHLTAVGAMCAVFLGHQRGDPMLETMCNRIMATDFPASVTYPTNTCLLYYNTMAIFQASKPTDERWRKWDAQVIPALIKAQRRDGCFDGSWDFAGTAFHGHETGRLLSTAYCCLSMEVYYRKEHVELR